MDYELLLEDYRSKDEEFGGKRVELEGWEGNFAAESLINLTGPVHTVKPTADCMRKCKVHVLRFVFSPARQEARAVLLPTLVSLSLSYAASYRRSRKVHSFLIIIRRNERLEESRIIAITHFAIHEKYKGEGIPLLPSIKWIH